MTLFSDILVLLERKEAVDQAQSEAVIALLTLIYQADGKVKHQEQDTFAAQLAALPWNNSGISKEAFHRSLMAESRAALDNNSIAGYIEKYVPDLGADGQVLSLLRDLASSDGEIDAKEAEILRQITTLLV